VRAGRQSTGRVSSAARPFSPRSSWISPVSVHCPPTSEGMPYPENLDHHFVVDPSKFDFYAMDCYRILGEDRLAQTLAHEVIRAGTDFDGTERSPMRMAEARITLGVVAARQDDLDQAVNYGEWALKGDRQSLPSLLMVSRELASIVHRDYAREATAREYLDHLNTLAARACRRILSRSWGLARTSAAWLSVANAPR
jgi:hypothetical protein